MKRSYDAIILGTGIAGFGCALGLARLGKKILVIGRRGMRGESSPAAAGILDPLLEMRPGSPLLKLSLQAFLRYPSFIRKLERQTHADVRYAKTGMLYVAMSPAEEKILRHRYRWQKKLGLAVRWLDRKSVLKMEPAISEKAHAGVFYPSIGKVNPAKLMRALVRFAKISGISVLKFSQSASLALKKGEVAGVRVGKNVFQSSVVINATGSWAGSNPSLKVKPPIRPARGQISILKGKARISTILHSLDGAYVVPWGRDEYLTGSTVEFVGFKPRVTKRGLQDIARRILAFAPGIKCLRRTASWAGLRPFPKDKMPLIGPTSTRGLYLAAGYYRSGILIGTYAGNLLAKGILSGKMPQLLTAFNPRRFEKR